jgi:hypothetical protein
MNVRSWLVAALVVFTPAAAGSDAPKYAAVPLHPAGLFDSYATGIAGGRVVGTGLDITNGRDSRRALLWTGTAGGVHDVTPPFFPIGAVLHAASDNAEVGEGSAWISGPSLPEQHAWRRLGGVPFDMHPPGSFNSAALGTSGEVHVGAAGFPLPHAFAWYETGGVPVPVDIHPAEYISSGATGTNGAQHSGVGGVLDTSVTVEPAPPSISTLLGDPGSLRDWLCQEHSISIWVLVRPHALIWLAPGVALDLHPAGASDSAALAISGNQLAGTAAFQGNWHAMLWPDVFSPPVDLHPRGFVSSAAAATNGSVQAGAAIDRFGRSHALVWLASGAALDLTRTLPAGLDQAAASGIDEDGNVVGRAWSSADPNAAPRAMLWQPVRLGTPPEAPRNLTAQTAGSQGVDLDWQPPTGSAGGYKVYRSLLSGDERFLTSLAANTIHYNDRATIAGVTYFYRITAVNDGGEGLPSNEASAEAR